MLLFITSKIRKIEIRLAHNTNHNQLDCDMMGKCSRMNRGMAPNHQLDHDRCTALRPAYTDYRISQINVPMADEWCTLSCARLGPMSVASTTTGNMMNYPVLMLAANRNAKTEN